MERPEAQDAGTIILTGFDTDVVLQAIQVTVTQHQSPVASHKLPNDYQIMNSSWIVLKLIVGSTRLSKIWASIKTN